MHELVEQLLSHLKVTWRYRWHAMGCAWIIAVGGWIAVYLTPVRYEAFARVYVDTQTMLRPLLAGLVVQPNVDQMVTMLTKTLVSRPNLEKVLQMSEIDLGSQNPKDREQLLAQLSNELVIQGTSGRVDGGLPSNNVYVISYQDTNPEKAKRVVQAALMTFVQSTVGDKRKDSDLAQRFIEEQLKGLNEKLVAAENAVTEFKRRNMGLIPGEGRDYYARLVEAQTALRQAKLDLDEAEKSRDSIKKKVVEKYGGEEGKPEIDPRVRALQEKLDALRLNYTEQHPDIVAIVRTIAQLKDQKEAEAKLGKTSPSSSDAGDLVYQQLTVSLAAAEAKVAGIKARVAEYEKRDTELKTAANAAPQVEAEYKQLTRDYDVIKANYATMVSRRESAQISGDMAADSNVIDFRVIDPPQVRLTKAPSRLVLMSLVLLVALGAGGGLAFLMGQSRPTFMDERRLREVSGLQVLGTVAMALTDAQKTRRSRGLIALLISLASLLSAYAAIMVTLFLTASRT
jgi:polysaccharide chain length determinant protein (PEP-CTERM system associated)